MSLERARELAGARGYMIQEPGANPFHTVIAGRDTFKAYLFELKAAGFKLLTSVMGVDYLEYTEFQPERFAVVYQLVHPRIAERVMVKVFVPDGVMLPSVTDLFKTAEFHEREVYDFFGIEFEGHPDLRKILTPEDLDGHPLRKDFPLGETPTLFREGRFIDPAAFRAGLTGKDSGLTGWRGGSRIDSSLVPKLPTDSPESVVKPPRGMGSS